MLDIVKSPLAFDAAPLDANLDRITPLHHGLLGAWAIRRWTRRAFTRRCTRRCPGVRHTTIVGHAIRILARIRCLVLEDLDDTVEEDCNDGAEDGTHPVYPMVFAEFPGGDFWTE